MVLPSLLFVFNQKAQSIAKLFSDVYLHVFDNSMRFL